MKSLEGLKAICRENWKELIASKVPKEQLPVYTERINKEFKVIADFKLASYFLIVYDLVQYAKKNGIRVGPGRGSAAGSLVSYLLKITSLDPIKFNLIFERFLNYGRGEVSFPDIDLDFQDTRRDEVLHYLKQKYGEDKVASIGTFTKLYGRGAIRDVARVLKIDLTDVDIIAKLIGIHETLKEALDKEGQLRIWQMKYPKLFEAALKIEGQLRNVSQHAAGVVVCDVPLLGFVPICLNRDKKERTTQWDMEDIESNGLLKIDLLSAKIQSIIQDTVDMLGTNLDLDDIDLEDKNIYDMLKAHGGIGLFQFDTSGMNSYVKQFQPKCFEDIALILALFRPATISLNMHQKFLDSRLGAIEYLHPCLESVLKQTSGVIVFQEQVIEIAQKIAGFSLTEGASLLKIIAKKKEGIEKYKEKFVQGCKKVSDIEEEVSEKIWEQMAKHAGYSFNLSHSTSYGKIVYQTAYLKTYHPLQYMCSLLRRNTGDETNISKYIRECRLMNIKILPYDISKSKENFSIEGDCIRLGFENIKGVGNAGAEIVSKQPYTNFEDFIKRISRKIVRKNCVEALIGAGAFDSFNVRGEIFEEYQKLRMPAKTRAGKILKPVIDLFGEEISVTLKSNELTSILKNKR